MRNKVTIAILALFVSHMISAADWQPLTGIYAITAENYLDPPEEEPKNSHFRSQLTGNAAKDLYTAIPGESSRDECTGGQAKSSGELRCIYYPSHSKYECAFSIDLREEKIEYGVAC